MGRNKIMGLALATLGFVAIAGTALADDAMSAKTDCPILGSAMASGNAMATTAMSTGDQMAGDAMADGSKVTTNTMMASSDAMKPSGMAAGDKMAVPDCPPVKDE